MEMTKEALTLAAVAVALHSAAMVDWGEGEGGTEKSLKRDRVDGAMYSVIQALQWANFTGGLEECNEMAAELMEKCDPLDPDRLKGGKAVNWAYINLLPRIDALCEKWGFRMERFGQVGGGLRITFV